ncbi:OLC1v1020654C1 [Oldenlandia corymbosa var. corymbosa]|uniref:OLC1v1020654C1 n=1 Tax=Oldenlandia corymbosa var. corymbosa TaxID=529605 RepID=A0AAV1EH10_OLDCO|nr:OLC1v1020654C1 [Oldenlandia corymbosa var. corymbosa]
MRGLFHLASRAASASSQKAQPLASETSISAGKYPSLSTTRFKDPNSDSVLPKHHVDHNYFTQILSRKDWYLLLRQEYKAKRVILTPQKIISILQNQENPLHPLRFYIWVLSINPLFAKNQSIRVVLSNALYRKGPVLLSAELVQDIRNSGFRITEDLLCVLVGTWGRLGLGKYSAEVFEQVSYLGLSPSTRLYNAVIDALVKANSLDLAYLKFQQMHVDHCRPDRFTFNILIHGVCKIGVVDEALRLIKQMEGLGFFPNVFTYTILIDGYCNAKRVEEAFGILEIMKEKNVVPNEATFRSLVNGVFRCVSSPREAFELLSRWVDTQLVLPKVACDSILCCLSDNSLSKEAASFLKQCSERGYVADNSIFNITLTSLIKGLSIEETCEILDCFIKQGGQVELRTYLTVIEALFSSGHRGKGDQYLKQMLHDGLINNVATYNMLIDCFCKAKMMQKASAAFDEMRERSICPNLVTVNTLMDGYYKAGNVDKARELLIMVFKAGLRPDIYTFCAIIDGLCRAYRVEDAFDCFTEMVEWGVTPNGVTYNILIRWLCVAGNIPKSMNLLRKMQRGGVRPDVLSFNSLIQSFCRTNKIERAEKMLMSMLELGLSPDNFTYSAFIKALCEVGRVDEAKGLFQFMEANGCAPDAHTCNLFLEILVKKSRFEDAQEIFDRYRDRGIGLKP